MTTVWTQRREWARTEARDVLSAYWPGNEVPINPSTIARSMGLRVTGADPGTLRKIAIRVGGKSGATPISGMLITHKNKHVIAYNENEHPNRTRFTIAHELGHYLDPDRSDDDHIDYRDGTSNPVEFGANEFAGSLLMPEDEFRLDALAGMTPDDLSRKYQVTPAAAQVRLRTLEL